MTAYELTQHDDTALLTRPGAPTVAVEVTRPDEQTLVLRGNGTGSTALFIERVFTLLSLAEGLPMADVKERLGR